MIKEAWVLKPLLGNEPPNPDVSKKWVSTLLGPLSSFYFGYCSSCCSPLPLSASSLSLDTLSSHMATRPLCQPGRLCLALFFCGKPLTSFHGSGFPSVIARRPKSWVEREELRVEGKPGGSHTGTYVRVEAQSLCLWRASNFDPVVTSDGVIPTGTALFWQDGKKTFIHHIAIIYPITGLGGHWHALNSFFFINPIMILWRAQLQSLQLLWKQW